MARLLVTLSLTIVSGYLSISPVFAAGQWGSCVQDVPTIQCLEPLFGNVIGAVVALTVAALFIMVLVGGFNFLFSAGDQKKLESARGTLTNALIGIVVIVAAYLILRTIASLTGVSQILNFTIPSSQ